MMRKTARLTNRRAATPVSIAGNGSDAPAAGLRVRLATGHEVIDLAPVSLTTDPVQGFDAADGRHELRVYNDGPGVAYAGGRGVSADTGIPIQVGQGWVENSAPDAEWHFVSASTSTLRRQVLK